MKASDPYEHFLACFSESFDIIVSTEELQKRMKQVNEWLPTISKEERRKTALHMASHLEKAQDTLRRKQAILEETILANSGQIKANSYYGKY